LRHGDHRVLHIHSDLIDQFLNVQLVLPEIQLRCGDVSLRGSITQWDDQLRSDGVVRKIPSKQLTENGTIPADEERIRTGAGDGWAAKRVRGHETIGSGNRIQLASERVVAEVGESVDARQHRILRASEADFRIVDLDPALG